MKLEKLDLNALKTNEVPISVNQETNNNNTTPKLKKNIWNTAFKNKNLKKPSTSAVLYLRNNGTAEPMEVKTKRGMFQIDGKFYHEKLDCKWTMGKSRTPLAIISENKLVPVGKPEYYQRDSEEKLAELQDLVVKGIRHAEIVRMEGETKSKINPKVAVGIIIALIIGFAVLRSYV